MIKRHWWKVLAVLILLYVFVVGLLSPLSQGITNTFPTVANTGKSITLTIEGYNTFFTQGENTSWLKIDAENAVCAKDIKVINDNNLEVTFQLPNTLPTADENAPATLVLNNTIKGYAIYPDAISVRLIDEIDTTNTSKWEKCANPVLTENTEFDFPFRNVLMETIRNLYFHVPFWFGMLFLFLAAAINSILYLSKNFNIKYDIRAKALVKVGLLFGIIGIVTGGIWAKYTWGAFWSFDIKQNMSAIALLIYMAYFVLRSSFDDEQQQARLSAIYNIFAFISLIPLLFIIPRMYDSLHPGNGGNPAFGGEDLDNTMRMVFYPSVIGWTLLGFWIANLLARIDKIKLWWIEQLDA